MYQCVCIHSGVCGVLVLVAVVLLVDRYLVTSQTLRQTLRWYPQSLHPQHCIYHYGVHYGVCIPYQRGVQGDGVYHHYTMVVPT